MNFFGFYDPREVISEFLMVFEQNFVPKPNLKKVSFKCIFTIINQQPPPAVGFVEITDTRVWVTSVYEGIYFNNFIKFVIANDIMTRRVDGSDDDIGDDGEVRRQSDNDFIDYDETSFQDQNPSDSRLQNVTRDLLEAMQDKSVSWEKLECSDRDNFVLNCFGDVDYEYDKFVGFEERIEKFKKDLKIFKEGTKESFYFAVLYGGFFKLDETKDTFVEDKEVLESVLGTEFLNSIWT